MSSPCPPRANPDGETVRDRALRLLGSREYSRSELAGKLRRAGFSDDQIGPALRSLAEQGWQSDERAARSVAERLYRQGYGPLRFTQQFRRHGLDEEAVALVMSELEPDWEGLAREALRRRFGATGAPLERHAWLRQARFLSNRGFTAEQVCAALERVRGAE